ncbi:MAG: PIN domain-containing protein [Acidimicrobiia bacterium]|nr:PIN domain-containing protein [Acidimicrobiia bacterium]
MTRYLLDTNILLYARGGEHPYRDPCRATLLASRDGRLSLEASVEVVQEYAHVLLRRGDDRATILDEVDEVRAMLRLLEFDTDVLTVTTELLWSYADLGVRDAVHAATAIEADIDRVLSTDRVFDLVHEVNRVDPTDPELMPRS